MPRDLAARVAELESQVQTLLARTAALPARTGVVGAPPAKFARFELKVDLQMGYAATAYRLGKNALRERTTEEFRVEDTLGITLGGWGRTDTTRGSYGYARYCDNFKIWEIIAMQHKARWVRFTLVSSLSYADATVYGAVLQYWDGYNPNPPGPYVNLINCPVTGGHYMFAGPAGGSGLACYDPQSNSYRIVQLECP